MMNEIANPMTLEALTESIRTAVRLQNYAGGEHEIPHNLMGILLASHHELLAAMKHFRAAAALDPTYIPARCNLELCASFTDQGNFAYSPGDCQSVPAWNPWKIVYDEKGIGHVVRRKHSC